MSESLPEFKPALNPLHRTRPSRKELMLLGSVLAVALFVRLYGIAWDHGYLFHPDERQVAFVTSDLEFPWPVDWAELFSPQSSWNPGFFSYGSLPLYLLRILANTAARIWPVMESVRSFYVIGRVISVLADAGTLVLVYALGRRLYDGQVALLASTLLTFAVLHVQLSHYYAVDTLLTCAVMLVLYLCVRLVQRPTMSRALGTGAAIGAACAIKISALALAVPFAMAWIGALFLPARRGMPERPQWIRRFLGESLRGLIAAGWAIVLAFVVLEPYALIDFATFIQDVATESMMVRGTLDLPYTRQYADTIPYLYQITQVIRWSLGPLLGIVGFVGSAYALRRLGVLRRARSWTLLLAQAVPIVWFLVYFGLTGAFHTKFLRYMLPVTPPLCLWGAFFLMSLMRQRRSVWRHLGRGLAITTLVGSALYAVAFLRIYGSAHPWEQATEWICSQAPANSILMIEHWDQPLPIVQGVGAHDCWRDYRIITFPAYDPDRPEKREQLVAMLQTTDYILLSSNRLYGSIARLPGRYPDTSLYYQRLFAEELGFELVYFAQVYPQLGPIRLVDDTLTAPGLATPRLLANEGRRTSDLVLGFADESFSVYDHPLPLVFKRQTALSADQLSQLLTSEQ